MSIRTVQKNVVQKDCQNFRVDQTRFYTKKQESQEARERESEREDGEKDWNEKKNE